MTSSSTSFAAPRSRVEIWSALGLAVVLIFFLASGFVSFANIETLRQNSAQVRQTHSLLVAADAVTAAAKDAETGQRGYLLTGGEAYLQPYNEAREAISVRLDELAGLVAGNAIQEAAMVRLRQHAADKMDELQETISLRRTQGRDAAIAIVETNRGKLAMDNIRAQAAAIRAEGVRQREARLVEMEAAYRTAVVGGVLSALLGAVLTIAVFLLIRRSAKARARQEWLQAGQVGLSDAMSGDQSVEELADSILSFLSTYVGAQAGALYKGDAGRFKRAATIGVPDDAATPDAFRLKEGLLGRVAAEGRSQLLNDIPDDHLVMGSALVRGRPRHVLLSPARADAVINGVVELGFLQSPRPEVFPLLEEVAESIGVALRSARYRSQLQDALEETQRQAEELQVQSEELRVSNEELEEQSRALKESQVRLEQQQVELEQTNSQLEEQAQMLETHRDELERAGADLELKAKDLEQASQYKSDFLANMSHELRTPLNSMLILSKLLGDDAEGGLSAEQVRYARTIHSSGEDLLNLINDILDLSKIEAGHVQVKAEDVIVTRLTSDLYRIFDPVAAQRDLNFAIDIAAETPELLETDRQRLEQILKNLLSNAFKFTESGEVRLSIRPVNEGLAFTVSDTGIGISPEHQTAIFEAFQQADGAISRRYGGTGLGLSISRELTRLLGGTLSLQSRPGEGSAFTLTLPLVLDPASPSRALAPAPAPQTLSRPKPVARSVATSPTRLKTVEDDRDRLADARRVLLVIEDDDRFAGIVRDLSRELGFGCLVAATAEEALDLARRHKPSAIVLDVGLPDQSGLSVLD
ncbi:hypothetical protein LTR94_024782, partial [Friedmanniomyces endolithicus]